MRLLCATAATLVLGCTGAAPQARDSGTTGTINAAVRFITSADGLPVTRIHVDVKPANITQDLVFDSNTDEFTGVITVPPGTQTVTATAYSGNIVLGTGSANATVSRHGSVTLLIKILDNSMPGNAQDHGPIIISVTTVPSSPMVGDTVRLEVTATDPENDPVTYRWTQDCLGTFSTPVVAATDWIPGTVQSCGITITVLARGLVDTRRVTMNVEAAAGTVAMNSLFIPNPYITQFALSGLGLDCAIGRAATDASCRPAIAAGTVLTATISFDPMPADSGGTVVLTDGCGGSGTRTRLDLPNGTATFTWTAPAATGSCLLTATASRETLSDAQSVAIAIQ